MANNRALTIHHLIDQETGETNLSVLKALSRQRAMADFGSTAPRYLRQALRYFGGMIPQMQSAWRSRHGLPVEATLIVAYSKPRAGVRRSAF